MKIAVRKMDEMEMSINLQAIRWSNLFTALALFAWGMAEFIHTHMQEVPIGWIILGVQNCVWLDILQILKYRSGDKTALRPLWIGIILIPILAVVLLLLLRQFPT